MPIEENSRTGFRMLPTALHKILSLLCWVFYIYLQFSCQGRDKVLIDFTSICIVPSYDGR